jgi:hypothetical protein
MSLPYELVDAWVNPNLGPPSDPRYDVGYLFPSWPIAGGAAPR